jgi:DNA-binding transcriptional regulator YhcF (GntR family)
MAHELKDIDERILETLATGRNVPSNLAEQLDVSRQWITQRLQQMESADYVTNVGRGVYELQPENIPSEQRDRLDLGTTDDADADALEHKLEQARDELEELRVEKQRLERELHEAESQSIDVDELRDALADAQRAEKNLNRDNLEDALDRMEEILDGE